MKSRSAYDLWNEIEQKASLSSQGIYKMVYTTNYLDVFFESNNFKELDILIHFDDITGKYIDINLKGIEIHTQIKTNSISSLAKPLMKRSSKRSSKRLRQLKSTSKIPTVRSAPPSVRKSPSDTAIPSPTMLTESFATARAVRASARLSLTA